MSQQRRSFSEEFKREAVKLTRQPGASKAAIARDLGIDVPPGMPKPWHETGECERDY